MERVQHNRKMVESIGLGRMLQRSSGGFGRVLQAGWMSMMAVSAHCWHEW